MEDTENLPIISSLLALGSGLWALGWERMIAFEVFDDWQKVRYRSWWKERVVNMAKRKNPISKILVTLVFLQTSSITLGAIFPRKTC